MTVVESTWSNCQDRQEERADLLRLANRVASLESASLRNTTPLSAGQSAVCHLDRGLEEVAFVVNPIKRLDFT